MPASDSWPVGVSCQTTCCAQRTRPRLEHFTAFFSFYDFIVFLFFIIDVGMICSVDAAAAAASQTGRDCWCTTDQRFVFCVSLCTNTSDCKSVRKLLLLQSPSLSLCLSMSLSLCHTSSLSQYCFNSSGHKHGGSRPGAGLAPSLSVFTVSLHQWANTEINNWYSRSIHHQWDDAVLQKQTFPCSSVL